MSKKRLINRIEVDTILKKYNIRLSKYNIDNEGRIDVEGDVEFRYTNLNYLPLKFGKVNGSFSCCGLMLQSLKGAPWLSNTTSGAITMLTSEWTQTRRRIL
jgi:hypothetical protein